MATSQRRGFIAALGLVALVATAIAPAYGRQPVAGEAEAASSGAPCTLRNLQGSYGYNVGGLLLAPLTPGNTAAVGHITLDKHGNFSGSDVLSFNDLIIPRTIAGNLELGPDCTGTARFTDSIGQVIDLSFVVVNDRKEILFIQTNPGAVVTGIMKKQ